MSCLLTSNSSLLREGTTLVRKPSTSQRCGKPAANARHSRTVRCQASNSNGKPKQQQGSGGLGDLLGPIGLTYSGGVETKVADNMQDRGNTPSPESLIRKVADAAGVSMGPISLTYSDDYAGSPGQGEDHQDSGDAPQPRSIASLTTEQWREKYEKGGFVDLWVEEEFNAGSRLMGGRAVHQGGVYGFRSGEGPSAGDVPSHRVVIHNPWADQVVEVDVPEDRYILWEAEEQGLELPYACRMGCCTACAVKVLEGEMYQPQALGVSEELKRQGYALMCVGYPRTPLVLEVADEDEVYELQFGRLFAEQATDPNNPDTIQRDDFALELANLDE